MGIMFETFHQAHARIFGDKNVRKTNLDDGISRYQRRIIEGEGVVHITNATKKKKGGKKPAKEICPHCATKNLIRVDTWTVKCNKCGFER
jgi:predicted RNA-binding Zn-ribbon protein involved in translation (DUF1610 family)